MMRSLHFACAIMITSIMTYAQSWCPPGAEWISRTEQWWWPTTGFSRVYYAGDTIVGGIAGQRLGSQVTAVYAGDTTIHHFATATAMITSYNNGVVSVWSTDSLT